MTRRRTTIAALALLLVAACARDGDRIVANGTIEMDEIDVASLVGGRIAALYVEEGDTVRAGDTLAVLDREDLSATVAARAAQAAQASAQFRDVRAGPRRAEIDAVRAELAAAEAQARLGEAEFQRAQALKEGEVISAAEVDRARAARDAAVARRDAAAEQARLVEAGSRREQVQAARLAAAAAQQEVRALERQASELILLAPASGVVLFRNYDPGEVVAAAASIVTLGDPDRLWIRAWVAAPQIGRFARGAAAEVRATGIDSAFAGRVVEIATQAEFTPRAALTEEERANLVFAVRIALDPTGGVLKAGLPAEARIAAGRPGGR